MNKVNLVQLPSGSIDIVFDGITSSLEFNCSCTDALPYCNAQCCRLRSLYGVPLYETERYNFKWDKARQVKTDDGVFNILQSKPEDGSCAHLLGNGLCEVHEAKPKNCKNWHCSPGGVGEGITIRANGWILLKKE